MNIASHSNESIEMDDNFDKFLLHLHSFLDKHCPQKNLNKKQWKLRSKTWINKRIIKMMKIRNGLFTQLKYTDSETDLRAFILFRNRVVNELNIQRKTTIIMILIKTRVI